MMLVSQQLMIPLPLHLPLLPQEPSPRHASVLPTGGRRGVSALAAARGRDRGDGGSAHAAPPRAPPHM